VVVKLHYCIRKTQVNISPDAAYTEGTRGPNEFPQANSTTVCLKNQMLFSYVQDRKERNGTETSHGIEISEQDNKVA
jgi:hypothetical protein